MIKFINDARLIFIKSLRESRRDIGMAFVFPMIPPLFFAVLAAATYADVVRLPGFPVDDYIVWLAPGAMMMPALIGAGFTATSTVLDAQSGYLDRLRTLPVSPGSVLLGRVSFDVLRVLPAAIVVLVTMVTLGAELDSGVPGALAVLGLTALLALAWNGLYYVATLRSMNPQTPMAMQPIFLPFLFLSTVYMPRELLPDWVQGISDVNPLTHLTEAARGFMTDPYDGTELLLGVTVPLAIAALSFALAHRIWSGMNRAD